MYEESTGYKILPNDTKITFAEVVLKSGEEAIVAFEDSAAATYGYMNLPAYRSITEKQALSKNVDIYFWHAGIYTLEQLKKNKKYKVKKAKVTKKKTVTKKTKTVKKKKE